MKKALLAGSFDPPTLGHSDLIKKAGKLCDDLIIAVCSNRKKAPLFSNEEKIEMLKTIFPLLKIKIVPGLLIDFAKEEDASFLIRGLRGGSMLNEGTY